MSMYHVKVGVPKTLVRSLIGWYADPIYAGEASATLRDILKTPISTELLPLDKYGNQLQETEELVGPYDLHDFFLYHIIRHGVSPTKILFLAKYAFYKRFESFEIRKWLIVFYKRFFGQKYKRTVKPEGPKIGSVSLSPRGEWRMTSDALVAAWLRDLYYHKIIKI